MRFQRLNNNKVNEEHEEFEDDEVFKNEEEDQNLNNQNIHDSSDMLTLEGLRRTYNSCSNCGVSWYDDHVSLDCGECGGYAMVRPCPTCNGQCGSMWRRDVKASRVSKHAEWHGTCSLKFQWSSEDISKNMAEDKNANFQNGNYHSTNRNHETHIL